jgi:hypothetical protein
MQDRIVCEFRKQIEGWSSGPADAELLTFARLALAEHRSERGLAQAKARARGQQQRRDARMLGAPQHWASPPPGL